MGKITEALKKVTDERVARIQKKPEVQYVIKKADNSDIEEHIVSFHDPSSPISEQYKILRTNILSLSQTKGYKTFAVTSAIHGEGKTVTAVNLAITMAHDLNNKSILLIDADMRKCRVAKYLGISQQSGLADVIKDRNELASAFVNFGIENLTVLPAGKVPRNPSELLGSKNMAHILEACKSKFDYIFIDTPPVMPLTDACIVGALVDGVIIVTQAGRTQRDIVKHAEHRLYQAHAKTVGCVLTNVEFHLPQYLYRYIHDYGAYAYKAEAVGK